MEDNIIPNTLKVDDDVNDLHFRNKNMNNLSNINNLDDFVCVFENVGIEYPKLAMGLKYKLAKTKAEKKEICESNKRELINGNLIGEGLLFLKFNSRSLYFTIASYMNIIEAKLFVIRKLEMVY